MGHLYINSSQFLYATHTEESRGVKGGLILSVPHLWYPFQSPWRRRHSVLCYWTFPSSHRRRWTRPQASQSFSSSSFCGVEAAFWGRQTWERWPGAWQWRTRESRSTWKAGTTDGLLKTDRKGTRMKGSGQPYRCTCIFTSCQQSEDHSGRCWLQFWGRHRSRWGRLPEGSQLQVPELPSRTWWLEETEKEPIRNLHNIKLTQPVFFVIFFSFWIYSGMC